MIYTSLFHLEEFLGVPLCSVVTGYFGWGFWSPDLENKLKISSIELQTNANRVGVVEFSVVKLIILDISQPYFQTGHLSLEVHTYV